MASKQTFAKVDHAIFQALWRWARRRHSKKSRHWIKDKYFVPVGNRNWVFQGTIPFGDGSSERIRLFAGSSMSIKRHTKVKGEANPYGPAWELYFEERLGVKMAATLKGKGTLLYLWHEQNGLCPLCNQKITTLTSWHNHHIEWRTLGGSDAVENRVLLHPNCHHQVHSQRLHVEETRVRQRALERLELHAWKQARAVLRGGGDGNVTSLPDRQGAIPGATRPFVFLQIKNGLIWRKVSCQHTLEGSSFHALWVPPRHDD